MAKFIRFWPLLGFTLPFISFGVRSVVAYYKIQKESTPNYVYHANFKFLVWKIHRIMCALNPYYKPLSKRGKVLFISRIIDALQSKLFIGREGETITIEKKILVLSALVQLTFGLPKYMMPKFEGIGLYPSYFYSPLLRQNVKGLTFPNGHILLSWFDTLKGFHDANDNLNLALHEWSHAFIIDHENDPANWLYAQLNANLKEMREHFKFFVAKVDKPSYLREYAYVNHHEFFAVTVEHFFESPETFIQELPDVYITLCQLLNQNPLNVRSDYSLG